MDRISALMDGELDDHQAKELIRRLKQEEGLLDHWSTFHLIGDALRGESLLSAGFSERLRSRLAQEPTVLAPRRAVKKFAAYALPAAASLAAVAVVGWMALFDNSSKPQPAISALPTSPATQVQAPLPNVPGDSKLNEYLMAHQEFSPSTALQGVAPYVRTVSSHQSVAR